MKTVIPEQITINCDVCMAKLADSAREGTRATQLPGVAARMGITTNRGGFSLDLCDACLDKVYGLLYIKRAER